jgi:cytochrome c553
LADGSDQLLIGLWDAQTEQRMVEEGETATSPPTRGKGDRMEADYEAILARFALGAFACAAPPAMRAQADDAPPAWAYAVNPPDFKVQPDNGTPRNVRDSTTAFTVTQARDLFFALDWHPSDHPPLPDIAARGRKPDVMACGICRQADGPGGPENASIAGLPAQYIVQQLADFNSFQHGTPAGPWSPLMAPNVIKLTLADMVALAAYAASLPP